MNATSSKLVYFIQSVATLAIKIGTSVKPKTRLADLQVANSAKLTLLGTTKRYSERNLHARFAPMRLNGEWFEPAPALTDFLRDLGLKPLIAVPLSTYTLAEWRTLRRVSVSTELRMRKAGLGPRLIHISAGQLGVTREDDLAWLERGGASGASVATPNPPTRNSGRDTRKATAASVASRKRKAAAAPALADLSTGPVVDSPAKGESGTPPTQAEPRHTTESVAAE